MSEYKPKILIVDDLEQNLTLLEAILRKCDAEIIKASRGKEALEKLNDHVFSLALLDVLMPEMDGFQLAEKIRQDNDHALLPIIFISANNLDDLSIAKGYKSGAVDYIVKPFKKEILISKYIPGNGTAAKRAIRAIRDAGDPGARTNACATNH